MTHPSKRFLIYIPIALSALIFLSYAAILLFFYFHGDMPRLVEAANRHTPNSSAQGVLLILLAQAAFVSSAILILFLFFRKTHSSEVFFFLFGLLGFTLQTSRFFMAPASLFTLSDYSLIPITRLVYFGRLCTVLSFFTAGLFATGFTSQRRNFYLSLIFFISFVISATLPVDFTSLEGPLLFKTGETTGFTLAYYAISIFTLLNFVLAAYKHSESIYWVVSVAILCVMAGIEVSFHFPSGFPAVIGLVLLIGGTFLFANRTHELYLWL